MARIRTIKPEFFQHEGLQDLEVDHPGKYPMMVFAGLWCQCDKAGRFEWKPRTLKLGILPFLPFDMVETLAILEQAGQIVRYTVDGKDYGLIPTFREHQRITGKEAEGPEKYPAPIKHQSSAAGEASEKQLRITRETPVNHPGAQEGKGKGKEGEVHPPLPPRKRGELTQHAAAEFERFWSAYPRKKNRGQAEKAWTKIKPDAGLVAVILDAVEVAKASDDWRKDGGEFVPYPATWLNAKGWLDAPRPACYSEAELGVMAEYNRTLAERGWPEALADPFSPERAGAIREFLGFSVKPGWVEKFFEFLSENLESRPGIGFDWAIRRDTYLRAREGNFATLREAA